MNEIDFLIAFFYVGLSFILFFFIISIFGYFFLFIIGKKREVEVIKQPYLLLERLLISFGIGISIYISYGYLLSFYKLFNFLTAYICIFVFDIAFIIYYLIKYKKILLRYYNKRNFRGFICNKNLLISIFIVLFVLILSFLLYWGIITESIGLIRRDPYIWLGNIYYLLENGTITTSGLGFGYPSGFALVTSGFVLLWSDYLIIYFFMKMASIYYLFLYIVISFFILKDIFKKNYLVFFSLLLLLISNHFLSRNILNIASSLASIIVLISFLVILRGYPYYILGFFITAIFLIHPLTLFYFLSALFLYFLIKLLTNIRNRKIIFKGFLSISFMLIISIIVLLPYMLNYPDDILNLSIWYDKIIADPRFKYNFAYTSLEYREIKLLRIPFYDFLANFIERKFLDRFHNLTTHSIEIFFFASFLGLFLYLFNRKKKITIFNVSVIVVLIVNYIPLFISNLGFIDTFKYRTLEVFALPIIIMAIFFLEWVLRMLKKITYYLTSKIKSYNRILNKYKPYSNLLKLESIVLILLFISVSYLKINKELPEYNYNYSDDYVEITFYIRENLESNSIILYPNLERDDVHNIIYDMNFIGYNLSEFLDISKFYTFVVNNHAMYFIFNNSEIPEMWKSHISYPAYTNGLLINTTQFSLYRRHN